MFDIGTSGPVTLEITRVGDHYEFRADNVLVYTTAVPATGDDYDIAAKDSLVNFQIVMAGDGDTTATVDDFGIGSGGGGGNDYTDWIADFPGVGVLTGFNDDADNDGNSNGLESYYGTDPSVFTAGVVSGGLSGNTFTFTHPLNETPLDDVSGAYLWSTDLETFYADGGDNGAGTTVTFSQGVPSAGMVTVTATITGPVPAKLFVNIEVTQP